MSESPNPIPERRPAPTNPDAFRRLVEIMDRLLAEDGCPWDREQTHASLKPYIIEEAYEVCEAIDDGDMPELLAELGDVGLQVVFHAALAKRDGVFSVDDVYESICQKLVRRHPHVFSDGQADTSAVVLKNWEAIKRAEREEKAAQSGEPLKVAPVSALDGIPKALPALQRATRLQKKAARVGFDWDDIEPVIAKVQEELEELKEARAEMTQEEVELEFGDLLFALVNYARFIHVDAEQALQRANAKFERRFKGLESRSRAEEKPLESMTLEEMDRWWDDLKRQGL
ncbi:MAG: nucleoside triphosphate pyrophosphohydrolase [Candidatus Sumerlaeia bacterium]|nr:nucleoside triphosphate pyrophosphohydrolase [Candidatus Sumerlaeia bacterium]